MLPLGIVRLAVVGCLVSLVALASSGCATRSTREARQLIAIVEPAGPGAVFATIDEAALDGLAYAYRQAALLDRERWAQGGTVFRVAAGYSYATPRLAERSDPDRVQIVLHGRDVAHFATYPKGTWQENRLNERHSDHDRMNVDVLDPQHRPAFILTPSLEVKGYGGSHSEFVATITAERGDIVSAH